MSGGYWIGLYRETDRGEVVRLQRHHWGNDLQRNERYLVWKYHENPYLKGPVLQLARRDGELVGMRGMFGACFEAKGVRRVIPCAGDVVIAPAHRSRGLFAALTRAAEAELARRGFALALNLSASPITVLGSLALGWKGIGALGRMTREAGGRWRRPLTTTRRSDLETTARPAAMAELVRRLPADGRVRHLRDADYFSWRFRNPLGRYAFLFEGDGALRGYLVVGSPPDRPKEGHIVDWEAEDDTVRADLLARAIRATRLERLSIWAATLPDDTRRLLCEAGFEPDPESGFLGRTRPTFLVRALATDRTPELGGLSLLARDSWDARGIYSDAF